MFGRMYTDQVKNIGNACIENIIFIIYFNNY